MYAGMEILPTTEGEQNTENASQFNLVNSWLHWLRRLEICLAPGQMTSL